MTGTSGTRTVLVSGGSRGIGRACVSSFVADGHRVAALSRSGDPVDGALAVECDVTDGGAVRAAMESITDELGPVEVLVANAGVTDDKLLARMSDDDFSSVIETNLTGAFRLARACTRSMMRRRFGRMVFVSSVGAYVGAPGQANYASSKAGMIGLARSIARELGSRGVTANVVAPGPIRTDLLRASGPDRIEELAAHVPVGRVGAPEEVAAAVRFLASDAAGYVTGAVLPVDGGLAMGH